MDNNLLDTINEVTGHTTISNIHLKELEGIRYISRILAGKVMSLTTLERDNLTSIEIIAILTNLTKSI